jgi:hypothetical protein
MIAEMVSGMVGGWDYVFMVVLIIALAALWIWAWITGGPR